MKALLLVLLLANLAFFGAVNGWLGESFRAAVLPEEREPVRSAQQVAPERVELLLPAPAGAAAATSRPAGNAPAAGEQSKTGSDTAGAAATPAAPAPALPAAPPVRPSAEPVAAAAAASAPTAIAACLELGGLTADDAKRTAERIGTERLAAQIAVKPAPDATSWMVYLPALASRAEADKAAGELRAKGFDDFFVIQDNSALRNAISLGVFRSEEAARNRAAALAARGVRDARVVARTSAVPRSRIEIRDVHVEARARLDRLAREFPGSEWRECPAPARTDPRKG